MLASSLLLHRPPALPLPVIEVAPLSHLAATSYHRLLLVRRSSPKLLQSETSLKLLTAAAFKNPNLDSSLSLPPPALNRRPTRWQRPHRPHGPRLRHRLPLLLNLLFPVSSALPNPFGQGFSDSSGHDSLSEHLRSIVCLLFVVGRAHPITH
jgi:hypothetical protein